MENFSNKEYVCSVIVSIVKDVKTKNLIFGIITATGWPSSQKTGRFCSRIGRKAKKLAFTLMNLEGHTLKRRASRCSG